MNRYEKENAIHKIIGYYNPPSSSDHVRHTVEERFLIAKSNAIYHIRKHLEDIEAITLQDAFPKYIKKPLD